MKIQLCVCLILLLPLNALAADKKQQAKTRQPEIQQVSFVTSDGFTLKGSYFPCKAGSPAVLLLHQLGTNRSEFTVLAKALQEKGINVLEYDARGHGESTMWDSKMITYESFSDKDFRNMAIDIDAAIKFLRKTKKIGKMPIGIVGASIQSSTGLIYASKHPDVKALVMLSPGLDYHGIDTIGPMKAYGDRPVFIAASIDDSYSYKSAKELESIAQGPKEKEILSDAGHGAAMFRKDPNLVDKIVDWLILSLKA